MFEVQGQDQITSKPSGLAMRCSDGFVVFPLIPVKAKIFFHPRIHADFRRLNLTSNKWFLSILLWGFNPILSA